MLLRSVSLLVTHELTHIQTHTLRHTLIQRVRKEGTMPLFPPPSSKDVFFFLFRSPRLPGRGTLPFVSKGTLSLSSPLLFSLSLIHGAQRARNRAREKSFTWARRDTGRNGHKGAEKQRGRERKGEIMRKKREMSPRVCVLMFCALFRSLRFRGE